MICGGNMKGIPTAGQSEIVDTVKHRWTRGLRPLLLWLLLVAVLFALHTHQRLMEQTRLDFTVSLAGRTFFPEPVATLDSKVAYSGQLVSLGNHQFAVTHPKGETFTTNLFVWYGKHDLGKIDLKRAKGRLSITANPPAPWLSIHGPEFRVTLTNTTGLSTSVPTDEYTVEVQYRHWQKSQSITVQENFQNALTIAPKIGALQLTCNQNDASFQLLKNDQVMETGDFPATIVELPEAGYKLIAQHHNHRWTEYPTVKNGATNAVSIEFKYGTAVLETKPAGAAVTCDGHYWGVTPLTLAELQPGTWSFNLRLDNYEPVTTTLEVVANETASYRTNLISQAYTTAMRAAREYMDAANYRRAMEALDDALQAQPDDPAVRPLRLQAAGLWNIQQAEALGKKGDYIAGELELNAALALLPNNEQAKQMLVDFKQHIPEQLERMRLERLARPKALFDSNVANIRDANLFESHELKSPKPYKDIQLAIYNALQGELPPGQPPFKMLRNESPQPETFYIEAVQEFSTVLATSAGKRYCYIVGGQTKDDETQIFFKVVEYKAEAVYKFSIGNLIGTPNTVTYVPIHSSRIEMTEALKTRVLDGVQIISERIQRAVGQ